MTKETHVFNRLQVSCAQVNQCSYSNWYPYFKQHATEAKVLKPLPQAFLDYLSADSIRLPTSASVQRNDENEYSDWEDDESSYNGNPVEHFQEFHEKLKETVDGYGRVLVKTNWTAGKDAKWILINNSLQCTSVNDVYLLLNASDHIAHDLDRHIYDDCEDKDEGPYIEPELVVKKWINDFNPALEFRIFIKDKKILGVSQRDPGHYIYLEDLIPQLKDVIHDFHAEVISGSAFPLRDYILDVYVPRPYKKVYVIDVNPFVRKWDSLLFTWHELLEKDNDGKFELRVITETNMGHLSRKDNSESQVPIEVVGAANDSQAMVELAREWSALTRQAEDAET
ncbi:hypothetical protein FT663_02589 [Candidozyma haemuli var. vulneris]|uniref:Uncharacterized protein n=1 Tax=Candidozyma haemuli TaxID=45357 RepID=A0A2V1AZ03_9ASCO|nr:hypothetical protein CXQ85_002694 [[Candida] haemuloni]KAF3991716.1 hypothetical protein FT663_02589 [[Candida] haemuloni var. vulneris]KAF3992087.1 hypothetical protein FT662_01396 [[Candida] haemuloni var. vulneris]PVH22969.1 hypothetical protein CXQ85_002694 [[Candida] haemuloni]